jgi:hypothetical protein
MGRIRPMMDVCDLREPALQRPARTWFDAAPVNELVVKKENASRMPKARAKSIKKPSCEDCYFRCNMLCALSEDTPCSTFRPDHPEGLRPPRQLRFNFRQEGRTTAAWAFPNAQEQAALHG